MKEEKKMVLKMLEDGKISSDEALKLLEALDPGNREAGSSRDKEGIIDSGKVSETFETIGHTITDSVFNLVEGLKNIDFSSIVDGNYRSKTINITEDLSHIGEPRLDFSSINGYISMSPVESQKIMIKAECLYKGEEEPERSDLFNFSIEEDLISFEAIKKKNSQPIINLDILLPKKIYKEVLLSSSNGNLQLEGLELDKLKLSTTNGKISLEDIHSQKASLGSTNGRIRLKKVGGDRLDLITSNGRIDLEDVNVDSIYSKTTNSRIKWENVKGKNLEARTTNGRIELEEIDGQELKAQTTNGSIQVGLSNSERKASYDLSTSFGSIDLNRPGLDYEVEDIKDNFTRKILAKDRNHEGAEEKMEIQLQTTHGSISLE